jgi:N-acetylneuraminic acid mutarotase
LRTVNNKLYLIGGLLLGSTTNTNRCFEYDPTTDTWTEKTAMPTTREDFGSAVYNGKIYCFGGVNNGTLYKKLEIYDPVANTWDATKADITAIKWSGDFGCECGGKIYLIGGSNTMSGIPSYPYCHPVTTIYEYDPVANTYATKTAMPFGVQYKECVTVGTKIYIVCGQLEGDVTHFLSKTSIILVYDTVADSWSKIFNFPYKAMGVGLASIGNRIYISGGGSYDGTTNNGNHSDLYCFDV